MTPFENIKLFDPQYEFLAICSSSHISGISDYLILREGLLKSFEPDYPAADNMSDLLILITKNYCKN